MYSKITIVLMIILAIFLARATWSVYQKNIESAKDMQGAQKEAAVLMSRQKILSDENTRLKTPSGFEAEIRSKYSVVKPGEDMYIIVDPKDAPPNMSSETMSWWNKVKSFFGQKPE